MKKNGYPVILLKDETFEVNNKKRSTNRTFRYDEVQSFCYSKKKGKLAVLINFLVNGSLFVPLKFKINLKNGDPCVYRYRRNENKEFKDFIIQLRKRL